MLDYGGGTLDVTLCRIEQNNRISIVYKDGRVGEDEIGCAGEAFDIELCKALIKENEIEVPLDDEEEPIITSKAFLKLQRCVEEWKITLSNQTTKVLATEILSEASQATALKGELYLEKFLNPQ